MINPFAECSDGYLLRWAEIEAQAGNLDRAAALRAMVAKREQDRLDAVRAADERAGIGGIGRPIRRRTPGRWRQKWRA